jgi:hypothetical protein
MLLIDLGTFNFTDFSIFRYNSLFIYIVSKLQILLADEALRRAGMKNNIGNFEIMLFLQ